MKRRSVLALFLLFLSVPLSFSRSLPSSSPSSSSHAPQLPDPTKIFSQPPTDAPSPYLHQEHILVTDVSYWIVLALFCATIALSCLMFVCWEMMIQFGRLREYFWRGIFDFLVLFVRAETNSSSRKRRLGDSLTYSSEAESRLPEPRRNTSIRIDENDGSSLPRQKQFTDVNDKGKSVILDSRIHMKRPVTGASCSAQGIISRSLSLHWKIRLIFMKADPLREQRPYLSFNFIPRSANGAAHSPASFVITSNVTQCWFGGSSPPCLTDSLRLYSADIITSGSVIDE